MRYAQIRDVDVANGPGIRMSLYVQGCHRHCPGCFNEETWDFDGGHPFTDETLDELVKLLKRGHISGITILGGEPLEAENRPMVSKIVKRLKQEVPNKSIWLYSFFAFEKIREFEEDLLPYIDVVVDGPFVAELKDIKLKFRGSSNQRIIDVQKSLKNNCVELYEFNKLY